VSLPVISGCTLASDGLDRQRERAKVLSSSVQRVELGRRRLGVHFGSDVDEHLVAELVAVERECCSFFSIGYEADRRMLTLSVDDEARRPALAAFARAFGQ
jgi:hypothetical protein